MAQKLWHQIRGASPSDKGLDTVKVWCVHGDMREYPRQQVNLRVGGEMIELKVAVAQNIPHSLILGQDWLRTKVRGDYKTPTGCRRGEETQIKGRLILGAWSKQYQFQSRRARRAGDWRARNGGKEWQPTIRWVPLSEKAKAPTRAYGKAAGYDLYAAQEQLIPANGRALVNTDLQLSPPPGSYLRIAPRSGLAWKASVDVAAGVIDPDFRGNVAVLLVNHRSVPFQVQPGDCIAQIVCERIWAARLERWVYFPETKRGMKGFGSSGNTQPSKHGRLSDQDNIPPQGESKVTENIQIQSSETPTPATFPVPGDSHKGEHSEGAEWRKDMEELQAQIRALTKDKEALGKEIKQELEEQNQQNIGSFNKALEDLTKQLSQVGEQVAGNQQQQSELKKLMEGLAGKWKDKEGETCKWVKQNQIFETQLGQYKSQLNRVEEVLGDLQAQLEQTKEGGMEEISEAVAALAHRVFSLEGLECTKGLDDCESNKVPVLRWPDDFCDTSPSPSPSDKRNKNRKRH
uniref:dUTP diphosphatase n=1 Tax=Geotrypetes seraphini TaxID=260995 RepID=A0A6P8QYC6_GEOSA|nr:uncharacterized protein LOC117361353 [Geotrypetes seraphini]